MNLNIFIFMLIFSALILITIFLFRKRIPEKALPSLKAGVLTLSFISGLFINTILGYIFFAISIGLLIVYIKKGKEKTYLMIIKFILLFMCGLIFCDIYNTYSNSQDKILSETSQLIINNDDDHMKMFRRILYEVDDSLFFTDSTIVDQINNELNIYNLCWLIEVYELYNQDFPIQLHERIKGFVSDKLSDLETYDLQELYYLSVIAKVAENDSFATSLEDTLIRKFGDINIYNSSEYMNKSNLFLKIIVNISNYELSNETLTILQEIDDFLISNRSKITELEQRLVAYENTALINALLNKAISEDEVNGVHLIINDFLETIKGVEVYNPIVVSNINKLYTLSSIYGLNKDVINQQIDVEKLNTDENLIYIDLQSFYRNEQLKSNLSLDYQFPDKLYDIKFWVYETYPPSSSIELMYYGLKLSEELNMEIDKEKYFTYLDSLIESDLDLFECYYLNLIYTEHDKDIDDLKTILENQYSKITFEQYKNMDYKTQYIVLYLDNFYGLNFYTSKENKIRESYHTFNGDKKNDMEKEFNYYYYLKIVDLLGINLSDKESVHRILDNIYSKDNFTSVYQVYRMVDLYTLLNYEIPYQDIDNYIKNAKTDWGAFYISPEDKTLEAITLRSFYEGLVLENIIPN